MNYVLPFVAAAIAVAIAVRWWQVERRKRFIFYLGWRVALDPQEKYVFSFRASFPSEAHARSCVLEVGSDMNSVMERSPNGERWVVTWRTEMPGILSKYLSAKASLNASVTRHEGGPLIASASKDGQFGMFLAS